MSESTNDDLPEKGMSETKQNIIGIVCVVLVILATLGFMKVFPMNQPSVRSHDGCIVKGINVLTNRSGSVSFDVYAENCTNSNNHERISYFHGPVYANILEYEKARDAKGDDFIEVNQTYNFTTEVHNVFGEYENIKEITLVK
jgi:hypothetical protein